MKKRYFLTRNDNIRMRYVSLFMFFVVTGFVASLFVSSNQRLIDQYSAQLASIEPLAGYDAGIVRDDVLKDSVYKNFNLASVLLGNISDLPALHREIEIKSGDSLGVVMERQGVSAEESTQIIKAMAEHHDPRKIRAGEKLIINFEKAQDDSLVLKEMKYSLDPIKTLVVERAGEGFASSVDEKKVKKIVHAKQAKVDVSLYGSAAKAGIPDPIIAEAIRIYSWNTDFQRDIRSNDVLEVMYESFETEDGHVAKYGDILYARLVTSQKDVPLYRFAMADGRIDYFQPDGMSIKRTLMRTPIKGARVSSGYGMRRHPILGYNKMHKGVDFAAPTGTPIYAAGDGVIEKSGWVSGYGKYIRVRHNSKLKTAYAHMSKIKVKNGQRVKQGDVIGLVGSTGRSTGPHLHYEVISNGKQVNPRSLKLPTGEELKGKDKSNFQVAVRALHKQFVSALDGTRVASYEAPKKKKLN
ncbi:MAG: peptidoglycan DD-metalloendopeptidase family protein [Pseudomonadota bacterium]